MYHINPHEFIQIPKLTEAQVSLKHQLQDLVEVAHRLGLSDAGDYIKEQVLIVNRESKEEYKKGIMRKK